MIDRLRREWPFAIAVGALVSTWGVLAWLSRAEPVADRGLLAAFPMQLGGRWTAQVKAIPERQQQVLKATDLMLRDYHLASGPAESFAELAPRVLLFVAFYRSQRTGATYHSPQHCLPGGGWQIAQLRRIPLSGPSGDEVLVNEVMIQKGLERQLIFYWYQDRGRILASEYWAKAYMVWDALTKHRSDGALVRVSVNVQGDVAEARQHALRFVGDMWGPLSRVLPGVEPIADAARATTERVSARW